METQHELKDKYIVNKAKTKAKKLREFYSHLRTYLIVNTIFFLINWLSSPADWWVLYPVIGWGFCLLLHAADTFSPFKDYDTKWEERKTKELIDMYKGRE